MRIVPLAAANALSHQRQSVWLELVGGVANNLTSTLGEPAYGEHLPGLGEIQGWGLIGEGENAEVSGAIFTGFLVNSSSVSVVLSAKCHEQRLQLVSLRALLQLPQLQFEHLFVRSVVAAESVLRVSDHERVVVETNSHEAVLVCQALVTHWVPNSESTVARVSDRATQSPTHVISNSEGYVCRYRTAPAAPDPTWTTLQDWE